tara:strand:- start:47 stop:2191 length:2145 start_codon:yes stop_codon:yes gene_type:complete
MNAYISNREKNRPKFPEDREKFGTEFMDDLEESAVGKFFDLSGDRQRIIDQASREGKLGKVSQFTQKIEDKVGEVVAPVLKPVGAALGKISDVTQIDERISTPLTFVAAGAAAKGISKIKPKHLGITQTIEPYTPPKSVGKVPRKMVDITQEVDDIFNMKPTRVQEIVRIAKKNKISYKKAEQYVNLKEQGIIPSETLNPGTNAGLLQGDTPLNVIHARLMQQGKNRGSMYDKDGNPINDSPTLRIEGARRPTSGNIQQTLASGSVGMTQLSTRGPKETYPQYFDKVMIRIGARKDEAGRWIVDEDTFKAIKNPNERREIAQMILTEMSQGVKGSFLKEKNVKNLKMNKDLARYNKNYAARADLHHGYPSVIGIEFFLGIPYMGEVWKQQIAIAAKYGNFPGQPMVEGRSNLVSLPSSMPSTKMGQPNVEYEEAREALEKLNRKVPKHIHRIIHDQFLTNEMGQKGEKFWAKWDPIIQKAGNKEQAWIDAYEDFNLIIARNRQLYMEALKQLEVIFSNNPLSNDPDKLANMLEEYVSKGKVTIGKGVVRGKDGKPIIVKPGTDIALSGKKTAVYSQDAVQYEIEDTLLDFKKAIRKERLSDPRYQDVVEEIELFPQLSDADKLLMEELLYKIRTYNGIYATDGARRAFYVTRITKAEHKLNIRKYNDLAQLKIFKFPKNAVIPPPTANMRQLKTTTHKNVKLNFEEQMQLILDF